MTSLPRRLFLIRWSKEDSYRGVPCGIRMSVKSLLLSLVIAIGIFYFAFFFVTETNERAFMDVQYKMAMVRQTNSKTAPFEDQENHSLDSDIYLAELNYTRLISPRNFSGHYRFVYVVHSRVQSRSLRDAVRRTWARDVRRSMDGAVVFLLGFDKSSQKEAQDEAETFDDIVQYDVAESYANLTRKSIMMLKWAGETLSKNTILVKTDDDVLVNVFNLQRTLQTLSDVTPKFIAGKMIRNTKPVRDSKQKWFVSENEYIEDSYPPYLAGCLYVITGNLIDSMLRAIKTNRLMGMEDVYITGILSEKLQLPRIGLRGINSYEDVSPCEMHNELARHYVSGERLIEHHHILKTTIRICKFWLIVGRCWCDSSIETILPDPSDSSLET